MREGDNTMQSNTNVDLPLKCGIAVHLAMNNTSIISTLNIAVLLYYYITSCFKYIHSTKRRTLQAVQSCPSTLATKAH